MSWIQVRAVLPAEVVDTSPFVDLYVQHGIENTLESGSTLTGCMVDVTGSAEIVQQLAAALRECGAVEVDVSELVEENWEEMWRQFFKPRRVGNRFVIRPSWEEFSSEPGDLVIELDPGQAFGTGDHPTTRLCLELLETVEVSGKDVADVGCGSGILSVGAVLLGARRVVAVDVDAIAVEVTKENAARNGVTFEAFVGAGVLAALGYQSLSLAEAKREWEQDEKPLLESPVEPPASDASPLFDIILSNIISAILIGIAPDAFAALRPGGQWIVSGIIDQNWPDVLRAANRSGFVLEDERREDGWVAARFSVQ